MKVIEMQQSRATLDEVSMGLAKDEFVVLRQSDGSLYALSHVDDFAVEAELLKNKRGIHGLHEETLRGKGSISLKDLRKELAL